MSKASKFIEALKDSDVMKKMKSFRSIEGRKPTFDSVLEVLEKFPWLLKAKFKNADVYIDDFANEVLLLWLAGTWENGTWEDGVWEEGRWKNGTWEYGTWVSGQWDNGRWKDGIWKNGNWLDGTWKKGKWEGGFDADGGYHDKGDSPDMW